MRVKRIGWAGTRTGEYPAMVAFLQGVLGLTTSQEGFDFAAFQLPEGGTVEVVGPGDQDHAHFATGPVVGFVSRTSPPRSGEAAIYPAGPRRPHRSGPTRTAGPLPRPSRQVRLLRGEQQPADRMGPPPSGRSVRCGASCRPGVCNQLIPRVCPAEWGTLASCRGASAAPAAAATSALPRRPGRPPPHRPPSPPSAPRRPARPARQ
jgi:hypothetical protein